MNRLKTLGLLALAAAILMTLTDTAAATSLTSPKGTVYTAAIKAESESTTSLHALFGTVSCANSTVEGKIESHGNGLTAKGNVSSLNFSECNFPVTVIKNGSLELHSLEHGLGTLTSTGAELLVHSSSAGPCVFTTNQTPIGTLTDTSLTGGQATLDLESARIPRTGGAVPCGSSGTWTGSYKVATPSTLFSDLSTVLDPISPLTARTPYTGTVHAESEGATSLHGAFTTVSCQKSTVQGSLESHTVTKASGKVAHMTFSECNFPVRVITKGSLELEALGSGKGTLRSSSAELTIETSAGDCVFKTSNTDIGTLTDSSPTGSNATLDIGSASIPRTGGTFLCGSSGTWTGSYSVAAPSKLYVGSSSPVETIGPYTGAVKAEAEGPIALDGSFETVSCQSSTLEGKVESHTSVKASGNISALTFSECNSPVTILKKGSLEIESTGGGKGTIRSSGAEITIETSVGDCVFATSGTPIGTLTTSSLTGTNATLDIESASIPKTSGNASCGLDGTWTGSYKVVSPSTLNIHPPSPVTSPSGTPYTSSIKAEADGASSLDGSFTRVSCQKSVVEGRIESHTSSTVSGEIANLSFTECNYPVQVLKAGTLKVDLSGGGKGTATSTDAEIKVATSVGDCTFKTSSTDIGTVTDSSLTSSNATLDIGSASIPRTGGSFLCGSSGTWTGSYKVTTPSTLYLD